MILFSKGKVKLLDLYEVNILMSLDKMKAKYDLQWKQFFRYLQLKCFILRIIRIQHNNPQCPSSLLFSFLFITFSRDPTSPLPTSTTITNQGLSYSCQSGVTTDTITPVMWGQKCDKPHAVSLNILLILNCHLPNTL